MKSTFTELGQALSTCLGKISVSNSKPNQVILDTDFYRSEDVNVAWIKSEKIRFELHSTKSEIFVFLPFSGEMQVKESQAEYGETIAKDQFYCLVPDETIILDTNHHWTGLIWRVSYENLLAPLNATLEGKSYNNISLAELCSNNLQRDKNLYEAFIYAWSLIQSNEDQRDYIRREVDNITFGALLIWLSEALTSETKINKRITKRIYMLKAENFIKINMKSAISRKNLCDIVGASDRTLSRLFEEKHGVGPMTYLKQQRLYAIYKELASLTPGETSVSTVATTYRFNHMGKLAGDYKKLFGETPSATLRR